MPTTTSADGVPIHYESHGAGEPCVLLVHGWAFDTHLWDRTVAHLSPRWRVVTMDLAGHGASGADRAEVTIDAFARDVAAVVEACGAASVVLVGHSLGGAVAVRAAGLVGERVRGVVLVDTLLDVDRRMPEEQRQKLRDGLAADFRGTVETFMAPFLFTPDTDPEVRRAVIAKAQAMEPRFGLAALIAGTGFDARPALAALRVPLRAVNADRFPTNVEAMRRHVPSYEVEFVPGVGHYPMLEKPDELNRLLERALEAIARPRAP